MSTAQVAISTALRWITFGFVVLLVLFLFVPVVIVVMLSFSNATVLQFPPDQLGLRQYVAFAQSPYWTSSVVKSLFIAFPTALVAMSLGASRARALIGITFRLTLPAILAAFVLAFLAAFDEATFVNFVGGPDLVTLPKAIFDSLRLGVDPLITGIATILMALTGITMMLAVWLRRT